MHFQQVSWVRHTDVHILAVGSQTFTTDTRFSASYFEDAGRFNLAIKRVEKSDEGTYECQISTKPIISFYIHLHVQGKHKFYSINICSVFQITQIGYMYSYHLLYQIEKCKQKIICDFLEKQSCGKKIVDNTSFYQYYVYISSHFAECAFCICRWKSIIEKESKRIKSNKLAIIQLLCQ